MNPSIVVIRYARGPAENRGASEGYSAPRQRRAAALRIPNSFGAFKALRSLLSRVQFLQEPGRGVFKTLSFSPIALFHGLKPNAGVTHEAGTIARGRGYFSQASKGRGRV